MIFPDLCDPTWLLCACAGCLLVRLGFYPAYLISGAPACQTTSGIIKPCVPPPISGYHCWFYYSEVSGHSASVSRVIVYCKLFYRGAGVDSWGLCIGYNSSNSNSNSCLQSCYSIFVRPHLAQQSRHDSKQTRPQPQLTAATPRSFQKFTSFLFSTFSLVIRREKITQKLATLYHHW